MSTENTKTLKVYNTYASAYLDNNQKHAQLDPEKANRKHVWLQNFLHEAFAPFVSNEHVLEIGAGDGSTSIMLRELGFRVTPSDVAPAFLDSIQSAGFDNPLKLDILSNQLPVRKFSGVLAWRVFVHFTPEDIKTALKHIYNLLRPGGRLVFNAINRDSENRLAPGWYDFPNEYHLGTTRFYQSYSESELRELLSDAGFTVVDLKLSGGKNDDKWLCFVAEKPTGVSSEITEYIESKILPRYSEIAGHTSKHIRQVIARSLAFAEPLRNVKRDLAYIVAAYHDLGRTISDQHHELESGKLLRADVTLQNYFSPSEIETMAEAVEDHRASLKRDPRNIYGKIVSSADRNTSIEELLERVYAYGHMLEPDMTEAELIERSRRKLREKYNPDGYAAKKIYFPDPDFELMLKQIEQLTRDPDEFYEFHKAFNDARRK